MDPAKEFVKSFFFNTLLWDYKSRSNEVSVLPMVGRRDRWFTMNGKNQKLKKLKKE
ncbi:MAG: hypothetical protein KAW16_05340 [candidate division Zixibacteria bacterium]|nr:hypothetical protein [candidate division Zixibacteria bacterium]